jgi:cellulose synthase/poly-beta-1,6-N-acetylglucosamine synthase-like glycosyltransferase
MSSITAAASTFWLATVFLVVAYVGYPTVIVVLGSLRPRSVRKSPVRPTVTILIAAYNEGANLARKLENCLALIYPTSLLDGSSLRRPTDGTRRSPSGFRPWVPSVHSGWRVSGAERGGSAMPR